MQYTFCHGIQLVSIHFVTIYVYQYKFCQSVHLVSIRFVVVYVLSMYVLSQYTFCPMYILLGTGIHSKNYISCSCTIQYVPRSCTDIFFRPQTSTPFNGWPGTPALVPTAAQVQICCCIKTLKI